MDINKYLALCDENYIKTYGKVSKVVGLTIESTGPEAKINDTCEIILKETRKRFSVRSSGLKRDTSS